ncbi:TetR/AcrR family transcriptional regulator [Lentzea jiangxiensis]|uniref:DNA-binding transcriptional regulator, AcrR family n=1 Tax=Lentzea jiangxiensis TaxID=641025 RepID=A0A1H0SNH5_9PSEU|nr:TetR/AcrR family transcriptional regulator [Lentzea jiangxiensis]SDP43290.1 DNA-binding transcriptional regulator, AcrR family [Lentzea jiangxiensis]
MATDSVSSPSPRPTLRERKKQRTREALIDTALNLFTQQDFDSVTLDELCDRVEVSKRTFFRTFASKEEVAMAPYEDMWKAFIDELETLPVAAECSILQVLQDAVLAAMRTMNTGDWAHRLLSCTRLAGRTPAIEAHCLYFCGVTVRAALDVLHRRFGLDPHDLRPRLALDILVAAFHRALEAWADRPQDPTVEHLATDTLAAFAAIPGSLTFTGVPPANRAG